MKAFPQVKRRGTGFTTVELMVVVPVVGILSALAVPAFNNTINNRRLKNAAVSLAGAFELARTDAIRTGSVHIVFYLRDTLGSTLSDGDGNTVPVLILDDGRPGTAGQNCKIDTGESIRTIGSVSGIAAGVTTGAGSAPNDLGVGVISTGSSFSQTGGGNATWVGFLPQGNPVSFDAACTVGGLGSGAGAFYFNNGERSAAVVLQPMGGNRVHSYSEGWSL